MIDLSYLSLCNNDFVYHYVFDIVTYDKLISKDYEHINSSLHFLSLAKKLSFEKLEENRAKAEQILHKVFLLNLQYALLHLHFCLCIIESPFTHEYVFGLCLHHADDTVPSVLNLSNLKVDLLASFCFEHCSNLESIFLPNGIKTLPLNCFYACTNLKSVSLPNSITELEGHCFSACTHLESVSLPNSVDKLGDYCFCGCKNLEYISLPDSIKLLNYACFKYCANLKSIKIPDSVTVLGAYCFDGCTNLESITLPDSVIAVDLYSFRGCINLKELVMPKSLEEKASFSFAFSGLPDSITIIYK